MAKTASGLVAYCKAQLGLPYWWGTFGQTAGASLYKQKKAQYPSYYTASDFPIQYGKRVHDCVGLIKGYRWSDTPTSAPVYNSSQDVSVGGLFKQCSKTGSISTIPDQPGVCVFMSNMSHVGVYIGDGCVIEARGHAYGVVKTKLSSRGWGKWGKPSWLTYDTDSGSPTTTTTATATTTDEPVESYGKALTVNVHQVQIGHEGPEVKTVQRILYARGIKGSDGKVLTVDGSFGANTKAATITLQKQLFPDSSADWDGIWGAKTWGAALTALW